MLGKLWFTQNLEISTGSNDILGKGYIFCWFCTCLGIPSHFPDCRLSIVSTNCLSSDSRRFFYDIKNVSLFPMHEFRLPTEYG